MSAKTDSNGPVDSMVSAALGALGWIEGLDAWLRAAEEAESVDKLDSDDPALLAVLGLVSLRRTTLRWLHEAASESSSVPERLDPEPVPTTGLLR